MTMKHAMKAALCLVLFCAPLLSLAEARTPASEKDPVWLKDEESGLDVPLPPRWSTFEQSPLKGAESPDGDAAIVFLTASRESARALEALDLGEGHDCEPGTPLSMESVRVGAREGMRIDVALQCDGGPAAGRLLLLDVPGERVFLLVALADEAAIERVEPIFERVMRSVRTSR